MLIIVSLKGEKKENQRERTRVQQAPYSSNTYTFYFAPPSRMERVSCPLELLSIFVSMHGPMSTPPKQMYNRIC